MPLHGRSAPVVIVEVPQHTSFPRQTPTCHLKEFVGIGYQIPELSDSFVRQTEPARPDLGHISFQMRIAIQDHGVMQ